MKIEGTGIEESVLDLKPLDHAMENANFVRAGQWDYERVTYDYKIGSQEKNITYYVRVQGYALEGDVDRGDAVIKLLTPIIGKHYYPHGIEYGEEENFPESVLQRADQLLEKASSNIKQFNKQ
ncbi:YugN family protein [Saliterribacillus persicus]|nr:YugN family protein [Saliterribacillus persicus]